MQERDPRRDVLGCNRIFIRTLQANPRKDRNQSSLQKPCFIHEKHSHGCDRSTNVLTEAKPGFSHLTLQPLSGMDPSYGDNFQRSFNRHSRSSSSLMSPLICNSCDFFKRTHLFAELAIGSVLSQYSARERSGRHGQQGAQNHLPSHIATHISCEDRDCALFAKSRLGICLQGC